MNLRETCYIFLSFPYLSGEVAMSSAKSRDNNLLQMTSNKSLIGVRPKRATDEVQTRYNDQRQNFRM